MVVGCVHLLWQMPSCDALTSNFPHRVLLGQVFILLCNSGQLLKIEILCAEQIFIKFKYLLTI